jgi:hypothetical protein
VSLESISQYDRINKAVAEMKNQRSSHLPVWKDQARLLLPYRAEFNMSDAGRGERQDQDIVDCHGSLAIRNFGAGFNSGVTPSSRVWHRLTTEDPDLAEFKPVKEWLHLATNQQANLFLRSNIYSVLPSEYENLSTFSNVAISLDEDFESLINAMGIPIGSFCFANDSKRRVRVFYREFMMSCRQIVERFGKYKPVSGVADWSFCSNAVKTAWDQSNYERMFPVGQFIEPNRNWVIGSGNPKKMRFSSIYFEIGCTEGKFLEEKGYDYFPVLGLRWQISGTNPYSAEGPGRLCIGDVKELQFGRLQDLKVWEQFADPAMKGPPELAGKHSTTLPGGMTHVDETNGKYQPIREVQLAFRESKARLDDIKNTISRAYYEDLMLRISRDERNQRATAQEIIAGKEEQYSVLGTVLQQTDKDLLDPLVEISFQLMLKQKRLPPPPKELQGSALKVEYTSILAQAQKSITMGANQSFLNDVGTIIGMNPESADKFNFDQYIDIAAEARGVSPQLVRSDDEVIEIRATRQQAQAAAASMEAIQAGAGAAKDLSQADLDGNNALAALVGGGG